MFSTNSSKICCSFVKNNFFEKSKMDFFEKSKIDPTQKNQLEGESSYLFETIYHLLYDQT